MQRTTVHRPQGVGSLRQLACLASLGALLSGCPSFLLMQGPDTLDPGRYELSAGMGWTYRGTAMAVPGTGIVVPSTGDTQLDLMARRGLAEGLDGGLRFQTADWGLAADLRWRFLDTPNFQAAVAPRAAISLMALAGSLIPNVETLAYHLEVPILMGFGPKGKSRWLGSVRLLYASWGGSVTIDPNTGAGTGAEFFMPGLTVGKELPVLWGWLRATTEGTLFIDLDTGTPMVQVGVALAIGK